jgi:hypothetical protein
MFTYWGGYPASRTVYFRTGPPRGLLPVRARRRRRRRPGGNATAAGSRGRRAPFSTDTASYTHTDCSLARPLLTYYSLARPLLTYNSWSRPFSNGIFRSDSAHSSFPCARRPPDSATSPVIVLYSRALCARLCVLALPPSPAGFRIWVSNSSSPPHTAHVHIH